MTGIFIANQMSEKKPKIEKPKKAGISSILIGDVGGTNVRL